MSLKWLELTVPCSSKRKECFSSNEGTDDQNSFGRRSRAASHRRATKRTETARKETLEQDGNIHRVEQHRVQCNACRSWIKLNEKRAYDDRNWIQHAGGCTHITGIVQRRVSVIKKPRLISPVSQSHRLNNALLTCAAVGCLINHKLLWEA